MSSNETRNAEPLVCVLPGVTLDEPKAIEDMKRRTHDGVIKQAGSLRTSGVSWLLLVGADQCRAFLDDYDDGEPLEQRWMTDQYRAFIDEHGNRSVIVVASCETSAVSR